MEKYKSSYKNNKFKISAPIWSDEFELPDGSYSISDLQDYFEYILKEHSESVDDPPIKISEIPEIEIPETMKLLGSTESKITGENGDNVPHLEVVELLLIHCNIVDNSYQQNARILYTFIPKKPFGSLLEISPSSHIFLKTFNSEFQEIKVWLTDQNNNPLEVEGKINLTLIIK